MKKQIFLGLLAMMATAGSIMAQQDVQSKAPNERTKEILLKLESAIGISNDQAAKAYPAFEDFYSAQHKAMEEMRASGTMDREAMKATREKLVAERDDRLKIIFTEEQMKRWKTEVEPSMHPQRKPEEPKK